MQRLKNKLSKSSQLTCIVEMLGKYGVLPLPEKFNRYRWRAMLAHARREYADTIRALDLANLNGF